MGVVDSGQKIEGRVVRLDGVIPDASAVDATQIQVLQGIAHEVTADKAEDLWPEVAIVSKAAGNQVGHGAGRRQLIVGVDRGQVDGDLVVQRGVDRIDAQGEVGRFAVATSQREADVESAVPPVQQAGVQRLVVSSLLGIVADQRNVARWNVYRAALGGDLQLAVALLHRPHHGLFVRCADVQLLIGGDFCNGSEVDGDVSGEVGVQQKRPAVRLHDLAAQVIAIFQRDLIGENGGRQSQKRGEKNQLVFRQHLYL